MAILEDVGDVVRAMTTAKQMSEDTGLRSGAMRCPKCRQLLNWQVIGKKGATRGACETPNCIAWIE